MIRLPYRPDLFPRADRPEAPIAIRTNLGAIFISLETSRSKWLITSLAPAGGEKMSKHVVRGGDVAGLLGGAKGGGQGGCGPAKHAPGTVPGTRCKGAGVHTASYSRV